MHSRMYLWMLLLPFILFPGLCPAVQAPPNAPRLDLSAGPSPVAVGGTVTVTLHYFLPEGAKTGDKPEIRGMESLSVVEKKVAGKKIVLTIIADTLEPLKIGPVELGFIDKEGKKGYVRSEAVTVKVVSNMKGGTDAEALRPIRDIIPIRSPWITWAVRVGMVLLVCAAVAVLIFAWKRWRRKSDLLAPSEPPHIRAEKEVEALLRENLFEKGYYKEFYFRLTEIIKRYLEAVRGFPAAEYTTEEIAQRILEQDRPILTVLKFADLVKFADGTATPHRKDEDIACFLAYINVTAQKEGEGESKEMQGGIKG